MTATRSNSTTSSLTVKYSLEGSAVNGSDYASLSGTVGTAAGNSYTLFLHDALPISLVEGNETVVLTLSSDAAYTIGSPNNATVTIADNDQPALPTVTVVTSEAHV